MCLLLPTQWAPGTDDASLPDKIYHYHSLFPLEDVSGSDDTATHGAALGVRCSCLKAISVHDGKAYVLRQVGWDGCWTQGQYVAGRCCECLVV